MPHLTPGSTAWKLLFRDKSGYLVEGLLRSSAMLTVSNRFRISVLMTFLSLGLACFLLPSLPKIQQSWSAWQEERSYQMKSNIRTAPSARSASVVK